MGKLYRKISDFTGLFLSFFAAFLTVKAVEIILTLSSGALIADYNGIIYGNLVYCCFISFIILVLYLLISLLSDKAASWICSVLLAMLLVTEIGLVMYYRTTGILMGKELFIRPLWETVITIKNSVHWLCIVGVIALIVLFSVIAQRVSVKKDIFTLMMLAAMAIAVPLFFLLYPNQDKGVVNKSWYFLKESLDLNRNELGEGLFKFDFDPCVVDKYLDIFPERDVVDKMYPLERKDNIKNVLGSYFEVSDVKPNIVVIVVESLGADVFGVNDSDVTFTPFLDSLAEHSLFWPYCLSTTPRSFGAVPAITGSVPHGIKGFQFGDIPAHNSMFSILANNGYHTNAFYSGDFSFDRVYDYLIAQDIEYMCTFYQDYLNDDKKKYEYTYWGYHDEGLFDKSLGVLNERRDDNPSMSLFVTISQHDNYLRLDDVERQKEYGRKVQDLISCLPAGVQADYDKCSGHLMGMLYGDDAIRHFFNEYNASDDRNTIFIITGDHSLNICNENPLSPFHVPLLIWSPLLKSSNRFDCLVSHNGITPSVIALLRDNYGLECPKTVHWVSDGLDTVSDFESHLKAYFLRYCRDMKEIVYDDYYFTILDGSPKSYRIGKDLNITLLDDESLSEELIDRLHTLVNIDNYVYKNNKITKHPILRNSSFKLIKNVHVADSVYCVSEKEKPSVKRPEKTVFYNERIKNEYDEMKVVVKADVYYKGFVWQDEFMSLVFECDAVDDDIYDVCASDVISKFFINKTLTTKECMRLEFTHLVKVNDTDSLNITLSLMPPIKDIFWCPEHTLTMKNVEIQIYGAK
ncbi:MAG: LTA synthase family protein [Candidatus Limimorpha sp.]